MTAKSIRIISPVLLFFFVFLVQASSTDDQVYGSAYDSCLIVCKIYSGRMSMQQEELRWKIDPKLLTGLFNHGVAILEANPNSLIAQGRLDAHALFFVAQGKATADLILLQDKRETLDLKVGDIIWIQNGTQVFMINKDAVEKLVVIKLPQPVPTSSEVKLLDPLQSRLLTSSQQKGSHLLFEN